MKFSDLNEHSLIQESIYQHQQQVLRESLSGLAIDQRVVVQDVAAAFSPLLEATLTKQQVQQLFARAHELVSQAGNNTSLLGRVGGVLGKIKDAMFKEADPVADFENRTQRLKTQILDKLGNSATADIKQQIDDLIQFAVDNPGKSAAVIGTLTAVVQVAAGQDGAAMAAEILKGTGKIIAAGATVQGRSTREKWLTDKVAKKLGQGLAAGYEISNDLANPQVSTIRLDSLATAVHAAAGANFGPANPTVVIGNTRDINQIGSNIDAAAKQWQASNPNYSGAETAIQQIMLALKQMKTEKYLKPILNNDSKKVATYIATAEQAYSFFGRLLFIVNELVKFGPIATNEGAQLEQLKPLSEGQVYLLFNRVELAEAGLMGMIKDKLTGMGREMSQKITAKKLADEWSSTGATTDSDELAKFLVDNGVDQEIVDQIYKEMKLPKPGTGFAKSEVAALKKEINQLGPQTLAVLARELSYQLGAN